MEQNRNPRNEPTHPEPTPFLANKLKSIQREWTVPSISCTGKVGCACAQVWTKSPVYVSNVENSEWIQNLSPRPYTIKLSQGNTARHRHEERLCGGVRQGTTTKARPDCINWRSPCTAGGNSPPRGNTEQEQTAENCNRGLMPLGKDPGFRHDCQYYCYFTVMLFCYLQHSNMLSCDGFFLRDSTIFIDKWLPLKSFQ